MQTFLPLADFEWSAKRLDKLRLRKQVVEAHQILNILVPSPDKPQKKGWSSHPAVKMWIGYHEALLHYFWVMLEESIRIGTKYKRYRLPQDRPKWNTVQLPYWFGSQRFHAAHRSNLLRKSSYYEQWGWKEPKTLEYVWPEPLTQSR